MVIAGMPSVSSGELARRLVDFLDRALGEGGISCRHRVGGAVVRVVITLRESDSGANKAEHCDDGRDAKCLLHE